MKKQNPLSLWERVGACPGLDPGVRVLAIPGKLRRPVCKSECFPLDSGLRRNDDYRGSSRLAGACHATVQFPAQAQPLSPAPEPGHVELGRRGGYDSLDVQQILWAARCQLQENQIFRVNDGYLGGGDADRDRPLQRIPLPLSMHPHHVYPQVPAVGRPQTDEQRNRVIRRPPPPFDAPLFRLPEPRKPGLYRSSAERTRRGIGQYIDVLRRPNRSPGRYGQPTHHGIPEPNGQGRRRRAEQRNQSGDDRREVFRHRRLRRAAARNSRQKSESSRHNASRSAGVRGGGVSPFTREGRGRRACLSGSRPSPVDGARLAIRYLGTEPGSFPRRTAAQTTRTLKSRLNVTLLYCRPGTKRAASPNALVPARIPATQ